MTKKYRRPKNSVALACFFLICILTVAFVLENQYQFWSILGLNIRAFWEIPGFEGAKCTLTGCMQMAWPEWSHYGEYVPFQVNTYISDHSAVGSGDQVYWANSDPYNALVFWDHGSYNTVDRQELLIETQKDIALNNLGYMGDPLDWNTTEFFDVVQYQPNEDRELVKTQSGEETYYTLTKRTILLVPAELHITLSYPAAHDHSTHGSGWQEGDWPGALIFWFKLDFTTWNDNAYPYAQSDTLNEFSAEYFVNSPSGTPYDQQILYEQKGGFPITAWVQGYLENVGPDYPEDYDYSIWEKIKSDGSSPSSWITEKSKATLDAKTQTLPALSGRYLALYSDAADPDADYIASTSGFVNILQDAKVYPFIPSQVPAYFQITLQALGTLAEGSALGPWDIYYPVVNYRIRVIYAVYGEFSYLWTVQTASDFGYPGWETRTYEYVHQDSAIQWLIDLFNDPTFLFFLFLFFVLIILVVLAVAAPGFLRAAGSWAESRTPKHHQPYEYEYTYRCDHYGFDFG